MSSPPSAPPLPVPRLRLTRRGSSPYREDQNTPTAGPSSENHRSAPFDEAESDVESTPRLGEPKGLQSYGETSATAVGETPAARLRALLNRVPNSSTPKATSAAQQPRSYHPQPPSDADTEFELPQFTAGTPSILARDSLKSLFSRALREPGGTPQKEGERRRNSIDFSEVETANPGVSNEWSRMKKSRKSLSDEEVDKSSRSLVRSREKVKAPAAKTFDNLRERLTNSVASSEPPLSDYEFENGNSLLKNFDSSGASPPAATSTPQRSVQMPSQLELQSNLLEQDSELQRALKAIESSDGEDVVLPSRPVISFPSSQNKDANPSVEVSQTLVPIRRKSHAISHERTSSLPSIAKNPRRVSGEASTPSPNRSLSRNGSLGSHSSPLSDYERERDWGRRSRPSSLYDSLQRHMQSPSGKAPDGSSNRGVERAVSPLVGASRPRGLHKRASTASLRSIDDDISISSTGSRADYRERLDEMSREHNHEREREWGRNHARPRPSSSLGVHSPPLARSRANSNANTHSNSSASPETSPFVHRQRQSSFSSSASSRSSDDLHRPIPNEVEIERERNWNAPIQKWNAQISQLEERHHGHHERGSPSPSPAPSPAVGLRTRAESLRGATPPVSKTAIPERPRVLHSVLSSPSLSVKENTMRSSTNGPSPRLAMTPARSKMGNGARAPSPLPYRHNSSAGVALSPTFNISRSKSPTPSQGRPSSTHRPASLSPRPRSPVPPSITEEEEKVSLGGWQFPRKRAPLPPLELDLPSPDALDSMGEQEGHLSNGAWEPSKAAQPSRIPTLKATRTSQIPVKTSQSQEAAEVKEDWKKHKRRSAEFSDAAGRLPPRIEIDVSETSDKISHEQVAGNEESVSPGSRTPMQRAVEPPRVESPPLRPPSPVKAHLSRRRDDSQNQESSSSFFTLQEASPPPSPPSESTESKAPPQTSLSLLTPPRRPLYGGSKRDFDTPSPPKGGLPTLPGPPTFSEDGSDIDMERTPTQTSAPDLSAMKTPRPPGGWSGTPLPSVSAQTWPVNGETSEELEARYEGGLATPVSSLSRGTVSRTLTPAPPGAWALTPALKKSVLKVRFDLESESDSAGNVSVGDGEVVGDDGQESAVHDIQEANGLNGLKEEASEPKALGVTPDRISNPEPIKREEGQSRTPEPVPSQKPSTPPRTPRKANIRIVDAFGRETTSPPELNGSETQRLPESPRTTTPRNKSGLRIVDAMGREIEEAEVGAESGAKEDQPLGHNEALARVRQGIHDLANGFSSDIDRSTDDSFDGGQLHDLEKISQDARVVRRRVSQTLLDAQSAELQNKSKASETSSRTGLVPTFASNSNRRLFWKMLWTFAILQCFFIIIMYRMSVVRAQELFLTTFYDPIHGNLHLYTIKPDLNYSPLSSSLPSLDDLRRIGWFSAVIESMKGLGGMVRSIPYLVRSSEGAGQPSFRWPPT